MNLNLISRDTIQLICSLMYPSECAAIAGLSRLYRAVIGNPYDSRTEYSDDDSSYVLDLWPDVDEPTWIRHGIVDVWVDERRHYQKFNRGLRDWVLTKSHYYFGFYGSNEPMYGFTMRTGRAAIYHDCYCPDDRCRVSEHNPYRYPIVRCAVKFADSRPDSPDHDE